MKSRSNTAFSLLELLIVLLIIALLVGISVPAFQNLRNSGKRKQAAAEIELIKVKLNDFRLDHGFLPASTFVTGTPPLSLKEPGEYDSNPDTDTYRHASRVLFLALSGRGTYSKDPVLGRDYLRANPKMVGAPEEESAEVDPKERRSFRESEFSAGSYLIDPWGNPYGYYYDPEDPEWKSYNSPSGYDIWSTANQAESDEEAGRRKWITSWKRER